MPLLYRLIAAGFFAATVLAPAVGVAQPPKKDTKPPAKPPAKLADPDDPFAPGAKSAIPSGGSPAVGGGAIPLDSRKAVTFGPPGCPVAVVGPDVWDVKVSRSVRTLAGAYEPRGLRALTADGKFFAAGSKSPNQTDTAVAVWNTETGQKVLDVPGEAKSYVDFLATSRNKYLLVGGRHNNQIAVWDIETAKPVKQLTVPDRRVEAEKIAFTPDGKHFACIAHDKIVITETASNKPVAVTAPPGPGIGGGAKRPAGKIDTIFVYTWTRGLAFSADGGELAAFTTHPSPRLLVWDMRGKLVMDEPVPVPQRVSHKHTLEWMPDGTGWLVNGHIFDRATRRVAVSIRVPFASDTLPHLLDKERVIGVFGDDSARLQTVTLPWDKLGAALTALATRAPAFVAPGEAVGLELHLAGLRGDAAETRRILTEAITLRLARDGVMVAAGRPTVLKLKLAEEAGSTLPIYERQSPFDFRGKDTGRKATEAKGAAVLELTAAGEAQPLWRGTLSAMSARSFQEEITDEAVRKSMLEHLTRQLNAMDMPYFIPKAKGVVALPAVVE